jgi:hypothetical protein
MVESQVQSEPAKLEDEKQPPKLEIESDDEETKVSKDKSGGEDHSKLQVS